MIKVCNVNWCNNKPIWKGYCRNHYDEIRKYGTITNKRPKGNRNDYILHDDYGELLILNENGDIKARVLIDIDDIDRLKKYSFRYQDGFYVKTVDKNKTKYLHRLVMNYDGDLEIDHINRNKLDNRKCNLRIVDRKTNANNIYRKETNNIRKVKRNLNKPYLLIIDKKYYGYYKSLEDAIKVRDSIIKA